MKLLILPIAALFLMVQPNLVFAQDATAAEQTKEEDVSYEERMALAKKMHELRPVREQVEEAINQYANTRPVEERESFKSAMRNVFNIKALEKISLDAYVETFTVEELRAMVEYYSKPEAKSASEKINNYAAILYPELMRMLDRAAIRVRTGK